MVDLIDHKIALYGRSGSGKGTLSSLLVDNFGYKHVSTGLICREISMLVFGNEHRKNLNSISLSLRTIDKSVLIEAALRTINEHEKIVFDSIRYLSDHRWFECNGYSLWNVDCPRKICIDRLKSRGQDFEIADLSHASEDEVANLRYDFTIENHNVSYEELIQRLETRLGRRL